MSVSTSTLSSMAHGFLTRTSTRLPGRGKALVELLVYAAATIVWWTSGNAWIGLAYAVVAVTVGLVAGRRRLA